MFYRNTRFEFALPAGSPSEIPGGIIAASAMPMHQLQRRPFKRFPYLQHRLFDPQLYLCGLSADSARTSVFKLSTYPWFGIISVPPYDSSVHGRQQEWKREHEAALLAAWPRAALADGAEISRAAEDAVDFQLRIGCDAIILPSPLTQSAGAEMYEAELEWLDRGLGAVAQRKTSLPVLATVAVSDTLLRGGDPDKNELIRIITDQVAARPEVDGIYLVIEQGTEDLYSCRDEHLLAAVLTLVDYLVRGAGKRVVVNYMGLFGLLTAAAGAETWASGYYLSQRRLRFSDHLDAEGRARPRYQSPMLLGDVGVDEDLVAIVRASLARRVLFNTPRAEALNKALLAGRTPDAVPEWEYRNSNIDAAKAHYYGIAQRLGASQAALSPDRRTRHTRALVARAVELADTLRRVGIRDNRTELGHQVVWLRVFERWMKEAGHSPVTT